MLFRLNVRKIIDQIQNMQHNNITFGSSTATILLRQWTLHCHDN